VNVSHRRWTRRDAEPAPRTFPRDRLNARLDTALRAPITLVVADEGLGKSTLIREFLEAQGTSHLRFTASHEHAEPGEFLRGLGATFSAVSPAMARSSGPAALQLERGEGESVALAWAREHLSHVSTTVMLDDLHHVVAEPRCASFLVALMDATVPNVRWIVALRDASALPVARWLSAGLCDLPIESDELRVQPDEIADAFAEAGSQLSMDQALGLYESTGGWALGLRVAAASGNWDTALSPDDVYDGLVDAALQRFTGNERDRIFECASAARFDADLLATLECDAHLRPALSDAELIHQLDDATHAFYEPCRQRIARQVDALPAEHRAAILGRTASALARVGRWPEALALHIRCGDEEGIAAALDGHGFKALDRGEIGSLGRALCALSDPTLMRYATALAIKAALASLDASFDVSEAWFGLAIANARDDERREIVLRYGMDLVRRGRSDAIELLEAETSKVSRSDADADAGIWALLGTAYVSEHRLEDAREAARHAMVRLPGVRDDALRARVLHQASYVALNDGDFASAKALAERALARADKAFLYDLAARALSVLFNVAMLHEDDADAARTALHRLEEAGRKAGSDGLRLYAILNAYSIEVDAGNIVAVERLHAQLDEMQVLLTPMVSEGLLPAQALLAAWDGRFEHAYEMLAPGADKLFDDDRIAYRWAEVAAYGAASNKRAGALEAIAHSRESLERLAADQPLALRSSAYLALAEILLGDDDAALHTLTAARFATAAKLGRMHALLETVAAFYECRTGGLGSVLLLGERLEALDRCGLGGVARFIGSLPLEIVEARGARSIHAGHVR
jgi:ATP/maltotriose-dependent transcriptional regulator MalT